MTISSFCTRSVLFKSFCHVLHTSLFAPRLPPASVHPTLLTRTKSKNCSFGIGGPYSERDFMVRYTRVRFHLRVSTVLMDALVLIQFLVNSFSQLKLVRQAMVTRNTSAVLRPPPLPPSNPNTLRMSTVRINSYHQCTSVHYIRSDSKGYIVDEA